MKERINFSQVPYLYSMCLDEKCPQADTCLRQLANQNIPAEIQTWSIVSPKYLSTLKGACPYYRSNAKARFAQGFINILNNLPHKQMQTVISCLITHYSRRTYYRIRKGERLLSPSEQQQFLNILKSCGVARPLEFDAYVEDYDW